LTIVYRYTMSAISNWLSGSLIESPPKLKCAKIALSSDHGRSVMRKAWLASAGAAAALAAIGTASTSASAGVAGLMSPTALTAHQADGLTNVTWRRRYYYGGYYPGYYYGGYGGPYGYAYPPAVYYPPAVTYYAVPAPRYVPAPGYYDPYYVRPYRSRYYYGW
jgi:hypothetical protein